MANKKELDTCASTLMKVWNDKLEVNFDTLFVGKPALKRGFVDCVQRLALINPDVVLKYSATQIGRALLEAAEMGLLPDNHECTIVEVGGKPSCWLMAGGARKLILQVKGVKYYCVEAVYENEEIVYDKLTNRMPVITMKDGIDFFNKGKLRGAVAFAEFDDGRVELVQVSVEEAAKYKPEKSKGKWHYSDKWPEEHLRNIVSKKLYKKLPKQDGMPAHIWDSTDTGEQRPSANPLAADMDAEVVVTDDPETTSANGTVAAPPPDKKTEQPKQQQPSAPPETDGDGDKPAANSLDDV